MQSDILCLTSSHFYTTAAFPCGYLDGHFARSQVAATDSSIDNSTYSELVERGFRRSGSFVYRPYCDHCRACKSIRIPVNTFEPDRSQRRAQRKHINLRVNITQPFFSSEHYALYQRYQHAKHRFGGMDQDDVGQYQAFLIDGPMVSHLVEFRENNQTRDLRMVSIIDELDDGLSAVYTFYDPDPRQSYGTFNVLWQIEYTRSIGKRFLYLGYWIEDSRKMNYKIRFKPCELLLAGRWQ